MQRSEIQEFDLAEAAAVLDGDGTGGHGYHRHGLGIKSDEFPPGWTESDVVDLVNAIVDHPSGGASGLSSSQFSLIGEYGGIVGVVRLRDDSGTSRWRIASVHPYDDVRWNREHD